MKTWVDIEEEYYKCIKSKPLVYEEKDEKQEIKYIENLNSDFAGIKTLLRKYLEKIENEGSEKLKDDDLKKNIGKNIYSDFRVEDFSQEFVYKKLKEDSYYSTGKSNYGKKISIKNDLSTSQHLKQKLLENDPTSFIPKKILLLNFNYTNIETDYLDSKEFIDSEINANSIHIHGSLKREDNNPIIFGYGDELDKDYKEMEDLNDNDYLENIKSIRYSNC